MRWFWNTEVKLYEMEQMHEYMGIATPIAFTYFGVSIGDYFFGVTRAVLA